MGRPDYRTRALILALHLQADEISYTPGSHRGRRAARILAKLRAMFRC